MKNTSRNTHRDAIARQQKASDGGETPCAVVVTGSSSGIGRSTAVHLASTGFLVIASVRKERDAESLRSLNQPNLIPFCCLDLSESDDIKQATEAIPKLLAERGVGGVYGIVHCAGGSTYAPAELTEDEILRTEVATRITGPVALTRAFLPALRMQRGRIIWIATPALIPIPFVMSIHACDFAVNCIARTLDLELKQWGIESILVRCGGIKTRASETSNQYLKGRAESAGDPGLELYRSVLDAEQERLSGFDEKRTDPIRVAEVVHRALTAARPKPRYRIGHMSTAAAMLELLPQSLVDRLMAARMRP